MLNHWWTIWSLPVYPTCYIWTSTSIIDYWKQADLEQVKQSLADFLTCFKKKRLHNRINDLEILGIVSSAVSSSIHLLLFFYLSTSISEPCTNHKKWDPPQSNFNPRSISNQQHYIGNHQNLLEEKKANFHGLYISVRDPLIDWCVNMGLKQQQQQQQHGEARRGEVKADCVCLWGSGIFCSRRQPEGLNFTSGRALRAVVSRRRCPTVHHHQLVHHTLLFSNRVQMPN